MRAGPPGEHGGRVGEQHGGRRELERPPGRGGVTGSEQAGHGGGDRDLAPGADVVHAVGRAAHRPPDPDARLVAGEDGGEHLRAGEVPLLGEGEHRGDDVGGGVATGEPVAVLELVGGGCGAVEEGGGRRRPAAGGADHGRPALRGGDGVGLDEADELGGGRAEGGDGDAVGHEVDHSVADDAGRGLPRRRGDSRGERGDGHRRAPTARRQPAHRVRGVGQGRAPAEDGVDAVPGEGACQEGAVLGGDVGRRYGRSGPPGGRSSTAARVRPSHEVRTVTRGCADVGDRGGHRRVLDHRHAGHDRPQHRIGGRLVGVGVDPVVAGGRSGRRPRTGSSACPRNRSAASRAVEPGGRVVGGDLDGVDVVGAEAMGAQQRLGGLDRGVVPAAAGVQLEVAGGQVAEAAEFGVERPVVEGLAQHLAVHGLQRAGVARRAGPGELHGEHAVGGRDAGQRVADRRAGVRGPLGGGGHEGGGDQRGLRRWSRRRSRAAARRRPLPRTPSPSRTGGRPAGGARRGRPGRRPRRRRPPPRGTRCRRRRRPRRRPARPGACVRWGGWPAWAWPSSSSSRTAASPLARAAAAGLVPPPVASTVAGPGPPSARAASPAARTSGSTEAPTIAAPACR